MNITFKNVGQGDSILLEWERDNISHYGLIDCNLFNGLNPILDEVKIKKIIRFDFIIVSHLHYDHYCGFADLLEYCIDNKIYIENFFHTFETEYFRLFSLILASQKQQMVTQKFLSVLERAIGEKIILNIDKVSSNSASIFIFNDIFLNFKAPLGEDFFTFSRSQARYQKKISSTAPDFHQLATIIEISNSEKSVLLTSDANSKAFKRLVKKITKEVQLVQVPHHGSKYNLYQGFWENLTLKIDCPALFSVGESPKDELPDKEVVEFFDTLKFYNESTNYVYGIKDFYPMKLKSINLKAASISTFLNSFSRFVSTNISAPVIPNRFNGDKSYNIF